MAKDTIERAELVAIVEGLVAGLEPEAAPYAEALREAARTVVKLHRCRWRDEGYCCIVGAAVPDELVPFGDSLPGGHPLGGASFRFTEQMLDHGYARRVEVVEGPPVR